MKPQCGAANPGRRRLSAGEPPERRLQPGLAAPLGFNGVRATSYPSAKPGEVVYNHRMVRMSLRAVAALFPFALGMAWQSPSTDGPIPIVPAARRTAVPESAPTPAIRVDASLVLIPA